jgi:L-seryl-tRNA(Ser) seleniumtransferase
MHDEVTAATRRDIPAVNTVLEAIGEPGVPRPLLVDLIRRELQAERARRKTSGLTVILQRVRDQVAALRRTRLQTVINATGIIIHTNLGRAPLAAEAADALRELGASYANLEQDLATGTRGARAPYVEHALAMLCHADAAIVVNNCAAALVLITQHLTRRKAEVVISRGEMVQI